MCKILYFYFRSQSPTDMIYLQTRHQKLCFDIVKTPRAGDFTNRIEYLKRDLKSSFIKSSYSPIHWMWDLIFSGRNERLGSLREMMDYLRGIYLLGEGEEAVLMKCTSLLIFMLEATRTHWCKSEEISHVSELNDYRNGILRFHFKQVLLSLVKDVARSGNDDLMWIGT